MMWNRAWKVPAERRALAGDARLEPLGPALGEEGVVRKACQLLLRHSARAVARDDRQLAVEILLAALAALHLAARRLRDGPRLDQHDVVAGEAVLAGDGLLDPVQDLVGLHLQRVRVEDAGLQEVD